MINQLPEWQQKKRLLRRGQKVGVLRYQCGTGIHKDNV